MRKAQVTPFVAIGLIIVALVGLFLIYGDQLGKVELLEDIVIPKEVQVINNAVDECIRIVSSEALNLAGSQGGYVYVNQEGFISPVDPFTNNLVFGNSQIPYWFYISSNNIRKEQVPSKTQMKSQLENYIKINLKNCLGNFTQFEGYEIIQGETDADVNIGINSVNVVVNWPLNIKYRERNFRLEKFSQDFDVPLGKLYDLALKIYNDENKNYFLEEKTIDMLVVYDEIPYSETNFNCGIKIWTRTNVEKSLRKVISQNIPAIKVKGTNYDNVDKYFEWDAIKTRENLDINLMYLQDWPLQMDVFPRDGEILKSDQVIGNDEVTRLLGSLFCINNYHFVYDIKYPVMIVLSRDGYIFQFATMVVIDNNLPRENRQVRDFSNTEGKICDAKVTPIKVNVNAYDNNGNIYPINNVNIKYRCSTTECEIGESKDLVLQFPACLNGEVIAEKEGYHFDKKTISTNKEGSVALNLEPLYELDYDIVLIKKLTRVESTPEKEQVLFNFINEEKDYRTSVAWQEEDRKIKLIPGKYKVESYILDEAGVKVKIEGKKIERCVDVPKPILGILFGVTDKKCVEEEIPETEIEQVLVGGANFEFEFTRNDLVNNKKITLYTLIDKKPASYDDIQDIYDGLDRRDLTAFRYPKLEK